MRSSPPTLLLLSLLCFILTTTQLVSGLFRLPVDRLLTLFGCQLERSCA